MLTTGKVTKGSLEIMTPWSLFIPATTLYRGHATLLVSRY